MAPELAGRGAFLEWRGVEATPEPHPPTGRPLFREAAVSTSRGASLRQIPETPARARVHALPPQTRRFPRAHSHQDARCHVHAGSRVGGQRGTRSLPAPWTRRLEVASSTSAFCGRLFPWADRHGREHRVGFLEMLRPADWWTNLMTRPGSFLRASLYLPAFPTSSLLSFHCVLPAYSVFS